MRRFTKKDADYYGYAGAEPLPSGEPLIGNTTLPLPDGSGASSGIEVEIVVSGTPEGFGVEVFGTAPAAYPIMVAGIVRRPNEGYSLSFFFPSEPEAVAFADLIESGKLSLQAIEGLRAQSN